MKRTGYDVRETDPFEPKRVSGALDWAQAPIVGRLHSLWEMMREPVIAVFPEAPGLPEKPEAYLSFVDDTATDALRALS